MNVHFSYKVHKTPDIEREITNHIEKLQKRVQVFRPELVHLKGIVEQNSVREGFVVSLNLRLPSGQMAAQRTAPTATAALKAGFDDVMQQLNKHKDLLRNTHKWPRRRVAETHVEKVVPFEKTVAAVPLPTVSPEDVRSYVNANLGRLERFIERELYFRETAEQIAPGAVSKNEVIDEVIARALGDGDKPERLGLEPWLYRVAIQVMDELARGDTEPGFPVHLEDSARTPNVRGSDEPELQFHQPDETLTRENVIADDRLATPEDVAYSDEMIALVQHALRNASRADREALILHAIEGFSVEEISGISGRGPDEVRKSIGSAREHLRRALPASSRFTDKLIQASASD